MLISRDQATIFANNTLESPSDNNDDTIGVHPPNRFISESLTTVAFFERDQYVNPLRSVSAVVVLCRVASCRV